LARSKRKTITHTDVIFHQKYKKRKLEIGIKIRKQPIGRRIAIGDIHGCYHTFESLVEDTICLKQEDQLFLLGDYIARGPRNREVLDYIIELQKEGFQIYPLMGNHEYFVLRDVKFCERSKNSDRIRDYIESKDLLNLDNCVENKYLNFIQNLPYYYELDNFILVHAGLDFEEENPLTDKMSMIYARNYVVDREKINGKIIIHGHTPINLSEIQDQIRNHKKIGRINLDNGCVYKQYEVKKGKDLGRLCALNLDNMELIITENID